MVEKVVNTIYLTSGVILLLVVVMAMSSCGTGRLTQKQIEIDYKLDKLYLDYRYESDSLINEFYKK